MSPGTKSLLTTSPSRATSGALFLALLGALTMLPPLATDVALPGLPTIAHALRASNAMMQWSLSVFVLAFGAGQLILGPLSDRHGRRPLLLIGLALFTIAGLGCTFSTNAETLIALRFVQGFGACAGTVCARAIVQDVAREDRGQAASTQGYLAAIGSLAPVVAPLLGAAILATLNWRWLYGILPIIGIALLILVATRIPETSPCVAQEFIAAYRHVLHLRSTLPMAGVTFGSFGAYFALIAGSPFVLVSQLHISSTLFAVAFALNASAALLGATVTGRLAKRLPAERIFVFGIAIMALAGCGVIVVDAILPLSPIGFTATMMLFAFAFGIVTPSAFTAALLDAGVSAGLVAGVLGAAQMCGGAFISALASALPMPSSAATATAVLAGTLIVIGSYGYERRSSRSSNSKEVRDHLKKRKFTYANKRERVNDTALAHYESACYRESDRFRHNPEG